MSETKFYSADFESVPVIGCSPPSWAVWLALLDKGVSFEHRRLSYQELEHKQPHFLLKSPRGTLPVLCVGDVVYSDTVKILLAVDDLSAHPALLGETASLSARGLARLTEADQLKEAGMAWLVAKMRDQPDEREKRMIYADALQTFSERLGEEHYFSCPSAETERPGLADWLAYAYVATTEQLGVNVAGFSALSDWKSLLDAHPHVKATAPSHFTGLFNDV